MPQVITIVRLAAGRLLKHTLREYARAGVPEIWCVNVPERSLEVYRTPGDNGYREITIRRVTVHTNPGR